MYLINRTTRAETEQDPCPAHLKAALEPGGGVDDWPLYGEKLPL